jgi:hypothetical protein
MENISNQKLTDICKFTFSQLLEVLPTGDISDSEGNPVDYTTQDLEQAYNHFKNSQEILIVGSKAELMARYIKTFSEGE